jgi:hypothetical protein
MKRHFAQIIGLFASAALLSFAQSSHAGPGGVVWPEAGDAGQTLATAQVVGAGAQPLLQITGTIPIGGDVDLFKISITDPANFRASTVNAFTNLDTELYLFNSNGTPVYANDDVSGSLKSTLPAGNPFSPLTAGIYYIGITVSDTEPVNAANQLLFSANSPSTAVRGGAAGVSGGLFGWDTSAGDETTGQYEIDFVGAATVPEASTVAMLGEAFAGVGLFVFLKARKKSNRAVS